MVLRKFVTIWMTEFNVNVGTDASFHVVFIKSSEIQPYLPCLFQFRYFFFLMRLGIFTIW